MTPVVRNLHRNQRGWTGAVDGIAVYLRDGNAYWIKYVFDGRPLSREQEQALDRAAIEALR